MRNTIGGGSFALLLLAGGVGCGGRAPNEYGLGPVADSVLAGKPVPTCTTEASLPSVGDPPFTECRTRSADTSVIVIRDSHQAVVLVSREWHLDSALAAATRDSLVGTLVVRMGAGRVACQDPSLDGTMWLGDKNFIVLGSSRTGLLYWAAIGGAPRC